MSPEPEGCATRRVPGAHGLTLRLREWDGGGRPLLFLHGFLLDSHSWDFVIPRFIPGRRVLALDCRGHGGSDHDPNRRFTSPARAKVGPRGGTIPRSPSRRLRSRAARPE